MNEGDASGKPGKIQEQVYPNRETEQHQWDIQKFAGFTLFINWEIQENQSNGKSYMDRVQDERM